MRASTEGPQVDELEHTDVALPPPWVSTSTDCPREPHSITPADATSTKPRCTDTPPRWRAGPP